MTHEAIWDIPRWIASEINSFIALIITILMLIKERKNRRATQIKHDSKVMTITPIIALIFLIIENTFGVLNFFNGTCYISLQMRLSSSLQYNLMNIYQIGRLRYCFANKQKQPHKGFLNWMINIMYLIGFVSIISKISSVWLLLPTPTFIFWQMINVSIDISVDLFTLSLYIYKLNQLINYENQHDRANNRIMAVLNRVLLLNIVYGIPWIIAIFAWAISQRNPQSFPLFVFWRFSISLSSLAIVYCLFIMQYHNKPEYSKFQQIMYRIGMYHCFCCCFKSTVKQQLNIQKKCKMDVIVSNGYDRAESSEDTNSEYNTLRDETIPTLNSVMSKWSSATIEEMESNEATSRDSIQSLATIHESDQFDTKMRKYLQFTQNGIKIDMKPEIDDTENIQQAIHLKERTNLLQFTEANTKEGIL